MTTNADVLFVGASSSVQCWLRCALPARALGADWAGVEGEPSDLVVRCGRARRRVQGISDFACYEIVVVQRVFGREWEQAIRDLRDRGVTVLYETDDHLPLRAEASCAMRACDGIICSTDDIAARYRGLIPNLWVCESGLDLGRYELTRPARDRVTIGWAGCPTHRPALLTWLGELSAIMDARPQTRFLTLGDLGCVAPFIERYGAQRAIELGVSPLENQPAVMANFDIALAPAASGTVLGGQSELRWLEASALAIPVVAARGLYPQIENGATGLHASTPAEAREAILALVDDAGLRARIGAAARDHIRDRRSIAAVAPQWAAVLDEVRRATPSLVDSSSAAG